MAPQSSLRRTAADPPPIQISTKSPLTDFISKVISYAKAETGLICYRGQRDADWDDEPALYRRQHAGLEESEKRAVRDLVSVHPSEFASDESMFDRLVRMQHFGLPTRLLDVSLNPLVALYFAAEAEPTANDTDGKVTAFAIPPEREKYYDSDSVSCIANLANLTKEEKRRIVDMRSLRLHDSTIKGRKAVNAEDTYKRLHQFIRTEKPYFLPIIKPIDLFKPYFVHPKMSNRRILARAGGFIIYGLKSPRPLRLAHRIRSQQFIIPHGRAKSLLRSQLDFLGINESNLFPEIDKAAKRIKTKYE